jgi:hypothetical protein
VDFLIGHLDTPIGIMSIICDDRGNLRSTDWDAHQGRLVRLLEIHGDAARKMRRVKNPHGLSAALAR